MANTEFEEVQASEFEAVDAPSFDGSHLYEKSLKSDSGFITRALNFGKAFSLSPLAAGASLAEPLAKTEQAKGFVQGALGMAKSTAGLATVVGENITEASKETKVETSPPVALIPGLISMLASRIAIGNAKKQILKDQGYEDDVVTHVENLGKRITEFGDEGSKFFGDIQKNPAITLDPKIFSDSFVENPSWTRATTVIAQAIPSLGAAVLVSAATKNPMIGASYLGLIDAESTYQKGREMGASQTRKNTLFALNAAGSTATELVPLRGMTTGFSKSRIGNLVAGAMAEGGQETAQQLWQNLLVKYGLDKTQGLFEGVIESFIAGAGSGAAISSVTPLKHLSETTKGFKSEEVDAAMDTISNAMVEKASEIDDMIMEGIPNKNEVVADGAEKQIEINAPALLKAADEAVKTEFKGTVDAEKYGKSIAGDETKINALKAQEEALTAQIAEVKGVKGKEQAGMDLAVKRQLVREALAKTAITLNEQADTKLSKMEQELFLKEGALQGAKDTQEVLNRITAESKVTQAKLEGAKSKKTQSIYQSILDEQLAQMENLKTEIVNTKADVNKPVKTNELAVLRKRVSDLKSGMKLGEKSALEDAKAVQSELIDMINKSELPPEQVAKFIKTVKNIQTPEQFMNKAGGIESRIDALSNMVQAKDYRAQIKDILSDTKPKKQGAMRVGKYDYETNKTFQALKQYSKMTQPEAQSMLESITESGTEADAIEKRFLSLQANGAGASLEIHQKVLEDLKNLQAAGEQAKDEQDFIKKFERNERVDEVVAALSESKAGKDKIKTKILNIYRSGFSNIYSMLNSMVGKSLAETYNPELKENARDTAMYQKSKEVAEKSAAILGVKPGKISTELSKMEHETYALVDFQGLESEVTGLDLLDIYNSLKNEAVKKRYYDSFGEYQINSLMNNLSLDEKAFADYLQEVVQSYESIMNQRHIELKNVDMGHVENYWPATSEKEIDVFDDIRMQGETPSALKERARGKVIPIPKNAWLKAMRHIAQAEHVQHLSREYEQLKRLFTNRAVRNNIENKFGTDVYQVLQNQIDTISLNKQVEKLDSVTKLIGKALNNWVVAKISLNPSVFFKQLLSTGNYMENMSSVEWTKHFAEGVAHPKKTFDYMWKNVPYIEARYNKGFSEAITRAIEDAEKIGEFKNNWTKAMTILVRMGDIGSIVYGGYPVIQSELAAGKSMEEAIKTFEAATLSSQQSGLSSSLSQFQNSKNPFARLLLAFKNTSYQYFRKQVDAMISHANGDISTKQMVKTLTIYGLIQPAIYGAASVLIHSVLFGDKGKEDYGDRLFSGVMEAILMNPFNAVPILDDIAQAAIRKAQGKHVWKIFSTPLFDDIESATKKMMKNDISLYDVLESVGTLAEPMTGAPVNTMLRLSKRFTD